MTKDEAFKRGMELLRSNISAQQWFELQFEITAIKEALAQPEQELVGYLCENAVGHKYFRWKKPSSTYRPIALYTISPKEENT